MGWNTQYGVERKTAKELKEYFVAEFAFTNMDDNGQKKSSSKIIKATVRGSRVYGLQEVTDYQTGEVSVYPLAMLTSQENGAFSEKVVNPIIMYHDFPISWLKLITVGGANTEENISEWKENIRKYNEKKEIITKSESGTTVTFEHYGKLTFSERYGGRKLRGRWINEEGYYVPSTRLYRVDIISE